MNFKFSLTLILAAFLYSPNIMAWKIEAHFNDGVTDETADRGGDGFSGAGGGSTYSLESVLEGEKSARLSINEGSTGYGNWGGEFRFPATGKGESIWFRVYIYFPSGFDYYSYGEGNRLKFLRIQTLNPSGNNQGYNDLYIDRKGSDYSFKWIKEFIAHWVNVGGENDWPKFDRWEAYEMQLTLDNVAQDDGGKAVVRVWKNGKLLKEITHEPTLNSADHYSDRALLFTYWNGGAPKTQHLWVDDIVLTNEEPDKRDAFGNPYLGAGELSRKIKIEKDMLKVE